MWYKSCFWAKKLKIALKKRIFFKILRFVYIDYFNIPFLKALWLMSRMIDTESTVMESS